MRYWKKFKEQSKFPDVSRVTVGLAVATYRQSHCLDALLLSLQAQTHRNFQVVVAHDGPWDTQHINDLRFKYSTDDRFSFVHSPERKNVYGHNLREMVRAGLAQRCDLMGFTNGDGYYAPVYFEWMASEIVKRQAPFGFCNVVHSHKMWQPMKTELRRGKIDVGCFLADAGLVAETPWKSTEFAADWEYITDLTRGLNPREFAKVDGFLYVHN